jgi:hypothetical protein
MPYPIVIKEPIKNKMTINPKLDEDLLIFKGTALSLFSWDILYP